MVSDYCCYLLDLNFFDLLRYKRVNCVVESLSEYDVSSRTRRGLEWSTNAWLLETGHGTEVQLRKLQSVITECELVL